MNRLPLIVGLSILASCKGPGVEDSDTGDTTPVDTSPPVVVDTGVGPTETGQEACQGLDILLASPAVEVEGFLVLTARGGTGNPRWLVEAPGLGSVTPSGIYGAPATPGTETITLSDAGCTGTVSTEVDVVPRLNVAPSEARIPPNSAVTLEITGGSGNHVCSLSTSYTGGTLVGCSYTGGPNEGFDVVRVEDLDTGRTAQAVFTVQAGTTLTSLFTEGWMVPAGSRIDPVISGGSGAYTVSVGTTTLASVGYDPVLDTDYVQGVSEGTTAVTVQDRHVAALSWTGQLKVLAPQVPPAVQTGTGQIDANALARDLDGDGFPELVIAHREASVAANAGGLVEIYRGTASGPDLTAPIWSHAGIGDREHFGKGVAFGDLDQDGFEDLVVGAPGKPWISDAAGEVSVFAGDGTGVFASVPFLQLHGYASNDRFGQGVGVCDVDGDGLQDLVVSDIATEPTTSTSRAGSVKLFLQGAGGLATNPITRYAARRPDVTWTFVNNGRLGEFGFDVGDFDHDGRCDVAASVYNRDYETDAGGAGFVLIWGGDASIGLTAEPRQAIVPEAGDGNTQFGRFLTVGNADGNPSPSGAPDDLLIGVRGYDGPAGSTNSAGAAFLYPGAPGVMPVRRGTAQAAWSLSGTGGGDAVGQGLGIGPDGDLLVAVWGERRALRIPGGSSYVAGDYDLDTLPAGTISLEPAAAAEDTLSGFGLALAPFGDGLFGFSILDRVDEGIQTRGLHAIEADGTTTSWLVGVPSGQDYGRSALLHDLDGNGVLDLVVGGPEAGVAGRGALAGSVQGRIGSTWTEVGGTGATFSSSDRRGALLARGDVDGTGSPDLLLAAGFDSRPTDPGVDVPCVGAASRSSVGHVAVHLAGSGALSDRAELIWWPPTSNARMTSMASGFDADGDGFQDVLVGLSDDTVSLVYGQAAPPAGEQHELCREEHWSVDESGSDFGATVTALGDLDGDGCDEVAIGAPNEDRGNTNQGLIRVLWGYGAACARSQASFTTHGQGINNARLGQGLFGVASLDSDALPELAVSGALRSINGDQVGDAMIVPGSWLASFTPVPATNGVAPADVQALLPAGTTPLHSWIPSSGYGESIAVVRASGDVWLAVGMPDANQAGPLRTGGITVYRVVAGVPEPQPAWWIGGESHRPDSEFSRTLTVAGDRLIIGTPGSSASGTVHVGGAYVAPL